jgi:hypothetical protein
MYNLHAFASNGTVARCPTRQPCQHRVVKCSAASKRPNAATQSQRITPQPALESRRDLLTSAAALLAVSAWVPVGAAGAFTPPPAGFRLHVDKLDGYYFLFPSGWSPVTTSGNDVFFRDPVKADSNLFVDLSSPSSSRYSSVADLGSPEDAAQRLLDQYLNKEFMSTRLGIRREGKVVACGQRRAPDGRLYYDIHIQLSSYGSRNPYVVTQQEIMDSYGLEWQRELLTVLGVANKRLYEFRLQADTAVYNSELQSFQKIQDSFRCKDVEQR